MYGMEHKKGNIAVGLHADIALWDPALQVAVGTAMLHDNVGYTPYEGRTVTGWPTTVISRGRVVVDGGALHVERGSGEFIACKRPAPAAPDRSKSQPNVLAQLLRGQPDRSGQPGKQPT
jgi:dihydropyrimidinase